MLSRLAALAMDIPIVAAQGDQEDAGGIPVASVDQRAGARMVMDTSSGKDTGASCTSRARRTGTTRRSQAAGVRGGAPFLADFPSPPPALGDWTAESGYQAGRSLIQAAGHGDLGSARSSRRTTRWRWG